MEWLILLILIAAAITLSSLADYLIWKELAEAEKRLLFDILKTMELAERAKVTTDEIGKSVQKLSERMDQYDETEYQEDE